MEVNLLIPGFCILSSDVVGERSLRGRSQIARSDGLQRSDDAGMSNDKTGEKPVRRKPKVSRVKLICPG